MGIRRTSFRPKLKGTSSLPRTAPQPSPTQQEQGPNLENDYNLAKSRKDEAGELSAKLNY